jgi:hypothetical protein
VAVVDPPRAGLHRSVLRALLACAALKRLVFVSCNPDTLVLNAGLLCAKYRPDGAGGSGGRGTEAFLARRCDMDPAIAMDCFKYHSSWKARAHVA